MMYVVDSHQNVVRRMFSYRIGSIRIRSDWIKTDQIGSDWIRSYRIYRHLILPLAKVSDKGFHEFVACFFVSDQSVSDRIKTDQIGSDL